MDGTVLIGVGTILVGCVQALIYMRQSILQQDANKLALFDRRFKLYSAAREIAELYVREEGRGTFGSSVELITKVALEAKFVFSRKAWVTFSETAKLVKNISEEASKHRATNPRGIIVWGTSPELEDFVELLKKRGGEIVVRVGRDAIDQSEWDDQKHTLSEVARHQKKAPVRRDRSLREFR